MAVTLNASTTSGFVQSADTSGIIQLQSNGTTIATISSTGLQQNVGAPAFSAYLGSNQSVSSGVNTKVQCNTEEFDTNSNYDNATNYRFTPTVAGYYQFNYQVSFRGSTNITRMSISLYKNGSGFKNGTDVNNGSNNGGYKMAGSALCYANGSTDYFELYAQVQTSAGTNEFTANSGQDSYFQAFLARSA